MERVENSLKFSIAADVFEKLPELCIGVVYAKGINSPNSSLEIDTLLEKSLEQVVNKFQHHKVKDERAIQPYRQAFIQLGINPNKFLSSIEAMATRIEKKKGLPKINPIVDLGNAISLKYLVPLGAHDVDRSEGDICIRFSNSNDYFIPFGEVAAEMLEAGELIYSVGNKVKTRRWIWRQSEAGKVMEDSTNVFFPIDGFKGHNDQLVLAARDELASSLQQLFACEVFVGLVDKENSEIVLP
jgi:DNA/RNA-binding domain of Phe-tRNA-synthetase-like protein